MEGSGTKLFVLCFFVIALVFSTFYFIAGSHTNGSKGKCSLSVTVLKAVALKQTDGWLGTPDLFVRVQGYCDGAKDSIRARQTTTLSVKVDDSAIFDERLMFGKEEWSYFDVTVIDKDEGEFGESDDDVLLGPTGVIVNDKQTETMTLKSNSAEVELKYICK
jgi:hypothetical protein